MGNTLIGSHDSRATLKGHGLNREGKEEAISAPSAPVTVDV